MRTIVPLRWERHSHTQGGFPDNRLVVWDLRASYVDHFGPVEFTAYSVVLRLFSERARSKYHVKWKLIDRSGGWAVPPVPVAEDGGLLELPLEQLKALAWTLVSVYSKE